MIELLAGTIAPTTLHPSHEPTAEPSFMPSAIPTTMPSYSPSAAPSAAPSFEPSATPSVVPTLAPSISPSTPPSTVPSLVPSLIGHMGYADALGEALKIPVVNGIPQIPAIYLFPVVLLFSFAGSLIGCLTTKPTEMSVLVNFYRKVRPWGFWKPVHQKTIELYPDFKSNASLSRDSFNVVIGIIWQMCMVITPIYFVIKEFTYAGIAAAVALICMAILKFSWYDKIED